MLCSPFSSSSIDVMHFPFKTVDDFSKFVTSLFSSIIAVPSYVPIQILFLESLFANETLSPGKSLYRFLSIFDHFPSLSIVIPFFEQKKSSFVQANIQTYVQR